MSWTLKYKNSSDTTYNIVEGTEDGIYLNNLYNTLHNSNVRTIPKLVINISNLETTSVNKLFGLNTDNTVKGLFINLYNLIEIESLNNTFKIDQMRWAFANTKNLQTVPNFDTSNAKNMQAMFYNCYNLKTLPNFNTVNTTNMMGMFFGCNNLTTVPNFNTSKVKDMLGMFTDCPKLTSIPNFDTSNVINMSEMFFNCQNLQNVSNISFKNVTDMEGIFIQCYNLTTLPSNMNTSKVKDMSRAFLDCDGLRDTIMDFDTSNVINMVQAFSSANFKDYYKFNTSNVIEMRNIFGRRWDYLYADRLPESAWINIGDSLPSVNQLIDVNTISLDSYFGLGDLTNHMMIYPNLTSKLNNYGWSISNSFINLQASFKYSNNQIINKDILIHEDIFYGDSYTIISNIIINNGIRIDKNDYFNNLTDISLSSAIEIAEMNSESLFDNYKGLINFTINNITFNNLRWTFENCYNLKNINNISLYREGSYLDLTGSFFNCYALQNVPSINLNNRQYSYITTNKMFANCINLININNLSYILNNTEVMSGYMFFNCKNLKDVTSLTNILYVNTPYMFAECSNLQNVPELDMDYESTSKDGMFYNCPNLTNQSLLNIARSLPAWENVRFIQEKVRSIPSWDRTPFSSSLEQRKLGYFGFSQEQIDFIKQSEVAPELCNKGWDALYTTNRIKTIDKTDSTYFGINGEIAYDGGFQNIIDVLKDSTTINLDILYKEYYPRIPE